MLLDRTHREFFWMFVRRDLKVRYAGSTLGALWNLIHPLVMIGVYMTIFSSIMRFKFGASDIPGAIDYGNLGYGVHLVAGMLPWLVFSDVVMRSNTVLIDNANFLQKIYFPPALLFLAVLFNALIVNGAGFLAFWGILAVAGYHPPIAALAGLAVMVMLGAAGVGIGFALAGLNVFFRDVAQIVAVAMQLMFWFNPIVYIKAVIFKPHAERPLLAIGRVLLELNPIERFISASQRLFGLPLEAMTAVDWTILFLFPALCLAIGYAAFRKMLPDARDCL